MYTTLVVGIHVHVHMYYTGFAEVDIRPADSLKLSGLICSGPSLSFFLSVSPDPTILSLMVIVSTGGWYYTYCVHICL